MPATRIIPRAKLAKVTLVEPVPAHGIRFAVDRPGATSASVQQGVTRWDFAGGHGWEFDFATVTTFDRDGVAVRGRKGGIVVDEAQGQVQLTLLDGERIGCNEMAAWGGEGPYTVTFDRDRITGRAAGLARFLYLTRPAGLDRLPTLVIDGQTYAPGTSTDFARRSIATTGDPYNPNGRGGLLIVPVLPGEHSFELKALEQPPIFRNWQAWPEPTNGTKVKDPRT